MFTGSTPRSVFVPYRAAQAVLTEQEKFSAALVFPSLFANYYCEQIASEVERRLGIASRLYLAPVGAFLNAALLPFTLIASLISVISIVIFTLARYRCTEPLAREAWNRSIHICNYAAVVAPLAMTVSFFTAIIDPTYPVVDRLFGGIPTELKI